MKQVILRIGLLLALAGPAFAQDTNLPTGSTKDRLLSFIQDTSAARTLVLAVYPSYAPDLINGSGQKDQWGFGLAALYPIGQFAYTGIRVDWLAHEFWAPSINVGLKADVQIFGINFTPMAYTGAVVPLAGAGEKNGDWGYIIGGGVKTRLWAGQVFGKAACLDLAVAAEKWSQFDGQVYHIAPVFKIAW